MAVARKKLLCSRISPNSRDRRSRLGLTWSVASAICIEIQSAPHCAPSSPLSHCPSSLPNWADSAKPFLDISRKVASKAIAIPMKVDREDEESALSEIWVLLGLIIPTLGQILQVARVEPTRFFK